MKRSLLIPLLLIAAGCSKETAPTPAAAPSNGTAGAKREVLLDTKSQKEGGIAVAPVEVRALPRTLAAAGRMTVDENRTWRIGAITEGRIIRVFANAGDDVGENQILARMHSHDIHESRAEYRKAVAEVARLKNAESYALRVRDRAKRLLELKAASIEQVEHAETELRNAQTLRANAGIELERARNHLVEFLEIPIEEPKEHRAGLQESDDDLIPLKAPAKGTVLARNVTPGAVVTTSGDLFVLSDLSTLWMIALVNEEYLPELHAGMPVLVRVQAYGSRTFSGRVGKLGEELDPTTRTVRVRVDVPNAQRLLRPEMYATAEIELGESDAGLFLPQEAVQEVEGQNAVFVQTGPGRFEMRPVRTGRTVQNSLEITAGLKAGERVAVAGSYVLKSQLLKASLAGE
ncbi:MAG: efflux RND transporter periplasmic adaptor subunit [Bryobacteraceae bacterium]